MTGSYEFRGNSYRKLTELNAWTQQRHEAALEPELPISIHTITCGMTRVGGT